MAINERKETINDVTLQGVIVYKFSAPKVTILTIATGNSTNVPNYPKAVFFGPLKEQADTFEKGDCVKVTGNIQSSKRNPEIKNQVLISVFAEGIEAAKTAMEEAFDIEGNFVQYKNEFKLSGAVVSVDIAASNILNITVRTDKNGRPSFVKLTKFLRGKNSIDIHPGEFVYVLGQIQTHKSETENGTNYFQNYVISEIKK